MQALLSLIIFGIFILIFIWDRLPMATSAILGCVVMVVCGLADFSTAFGQFASSTVILLMGVMVVGSALAETGVADAFGRLLNRFVNSNERIVIAAAYIISALLSSFLTNVIVMAIFMPIIIGMSGENKELDPKNIVLPVLIGTSMGGISTLVGSSQQLTANGLLEEMGCGFGVFDFTPVGAILTVGGLLFSLFIGYPIGKRVWGGRADTECEVKAASGKHDKRKFYTMIVITVLMLVSYIFALVPPVITAVSAALLCIITGCISQKDAVTKMNWNVVGRLGACLGLAKVISSTGGVQLMADFMQGLIGGSVSPYALFIIAVLLTQLLSLVISNSTAILIVLPVCLSLTEPLGLNPQCFAMGCTLSASIGICCPLSGSTNQLTMAAGYKFRDYFKYGVIMDALGFLLTVIFVPVFFPVTL